MTAEILTIGDELLIGQVINTNQAYIAEQLNLINIRVARMKSVGDELDEILPAFQSAWEKYDVVIVTGGLGPTHDDITKKAVCSFFDSDLVSNDQVRRHIQELWKHRNMRWTQSSDEQTMVPRKAELIENPVGTAAGFLFKNEKKRFIVLPGVPYEMKEMIDGSVIPLLSPLAGGMAIRHRTLRTTGIPESVLAERLGTSRHCCRAQSSLSSRHQLECDSGSPCSTQTPMRRSGACGRSKIASVRGQPGSSTASRRKNSKRYSGGC